LGVFAGSGDRAGVGEVVCWITFGVAGALKRRREEIEGASARW
jgi:hypothetical protein